MGGRRGKDVFYAAIVDAFGRAVAGQQAPQVERWFNAWEDAVTRDKRTEHRMARSGVARDLRRAHWAEILRRVERRVPGRQAALVATQRLLEDHGRSVSLRTLERVRAAQLAAPWKDPLWGKLADDYWLTRTQAKEEEESDPRWWLDLRPEALALCALVASELSPAPPHLQATVTRRRGRPRHP